MVEFKWIRISLFLIAVLQFTAAAEGLLSSFTVRAGEEVTLPCENVIDDQQNCNSTTWTFGYSTQRATVELIELGQIGENAKSKSDRLSVTQNCSLVIKKVTDEDAGRYYCQQYKSGQRQGQDSSVYLSVVTMTEHKNTDQTDGNKVQQLFPFRLQPSGEKPGGSSFSLWWSIIVSVGLAALIIMAVAVDMWTRTKGRKTQTDENVVADDEDDGAVDYENATSSV